jgi:hypothetical protein
MLALLHSLLHAATAAVPGTDDMRDLGRGVRAAREMVDAGQRFQFARANTAALQPLMNVTFPEILALHRAEGAFCMPPANLSLLHAPLILTVPTLGPGTPSGPPAPRTESAFLSLRTAAGDRIGFSRPGYVPTFVSTATGRDRDLVVIVANALTLGGLDNIVSWELTYDNANNELASLVDKAITDDVAGIRTEISAWDPANQKQVARGIAMAHLEADESLTGDALITKVVTDLKALSIYAAAVTATTFAFLDDDARTCTKKNLELTARWYLSRTRPDTLLARRDRTAQFRSMLRLSRYMSYLRFHSGDVIFVGLLLRAAADLAALKTQWTAAMGSASFSTAIGSIPDSDFAAALAASGFTALTTAEKNAIASALTLWKDETIGAKYDKRRGESVWRYVGLHASITAPWKPAPPSPAAADTARMKALADAVLSAMTVIRDRDLMKPISLALEYMPLDRLFGIASFNQKNWAANLRKAENFERLRLFIDKACTRAALDDSGNRVP